MQHLEGKFEIKSWDENPYLELEGDMKLTRASVVQSIDSAELSGEATSESLMFYAADGSAHYVGFQHFVGRLAGRSGSFIEQTIGRYEDGAAKSTSFVVPGSGTGELKGLSGEGSSVSRHDDYPFRPFTLDYDFG